ncbi:FecR family protein [Hanstruepera marina]|uniref:FecR family protein n=1 Tax=Hanstruepera marina TaxID=2873265 RepID=UPI001CA6E36B|nr:FecR family protein [Hanstruepera marina]
MEEDYLLKKWLNNELTDEEKEIFQNQEDFAFNQQIIDSAKKFKASDHVTIADFEDFKHQYKKQAANKSKASWYKPFLRIAAVLVVGLGIYFSFILNQTTNIDTQIGESTTVMLPDNSKVTLNALSSLTFKEKNWEENRTLNLEGEAFFKVAKGKKFDVVTSSGTVTVVGTEFNVKNRAHYFEVQCFEGIVQVKSDTLSKRLIAGNTFKIYKNQFSQSNVSQESPNWLRNKSSFENIAFQDVIEELERQYEITIKTNNIDLNRLFTGTFIHHDLENALISITKPMNLLYKFSTNNSVLIYEASN